MSKTLLKKELQHLDRDELIRVLLDLYTARKEARDWLDFFADPNVAARAEKARTAIAKELGRGYGLSKARISHIRKTVRDFASLSPGDDAIADLMVYTIEKAFAESRHRRFSNTLISGLQRFMDDTIAHLDDTGQLDTLLPRLQDATIALTRYSTLKPFLAESLERQSARSLLHRREKSH